MAEKRPPKPREPHKRHMRNYLLDRSFQLKYAGLLFAVAAILSATLGWLLWNESQLLIHHSRSAVARGQHAVELGAQVSAESRKVTEVVRMNIVSDPMYAENPELLEELQADNAEADAKVVAQEKELADNAATLRHQADDLEARQQKMSYALIGLLTLLAVLMGLLGIVVTHRVAGPIFKMTRQIRTIGDGDWSVPAPLRKGDELADFFGAFEDMVKNMRAQRKREIAMLEKALEGGPPTALGELQTEMEKVLSFDGRDTSAK